MRKVNEMYSAVKKSIWYIIMILLGAFFILPILWMVSNSFKTAPQMIIYPPQFIPNPVTLRSFTEGFSRLPIVNYTRNSIVVTFLSVLGNVFSSSLVGFGFARLKARLKDFWFFMLLSTMMIPGFVTLLPTYILYSKLGFVNTYLPLVLPCFLGLPFYIFLLRQFFINMPSELMDAGKIDGCSLFDIYFRIFLPNVKPAVLVVIIFSFANTWNDFFGPMIYLNSSKKYTLAVGIAFLKSTYGATLDLGPLMAVSLYSVLPIIVLYIFAQKYFVQGIVTTGLK